MKSIKVLHITAHLGGGVGRALSGLVRYRQGSESPVKDIFVCLEAPSNQRYADEITAAGGELHIAPSVAQFESLLAAADIVQLEWWHHPLLAGWLGRMKETPVRLAVWAHISGLHFPDISPAFIDMPQAFVFTSTVSLSEVRRAGRTTQNIVQAVSSTGGVDDLPLPNREAGATPRFVYLGSLNPAKLHPEVVDYLNAVDVPGFLVNFYGDASVNPHLRSFAARADARLALHGYTDQPGTVLSEADVLVYLLNPTHYGTTENALVEAMACGVVPVVLANPVEKAIVEDGKTGLVVDSPQAFAEAISFLYHNPAERLRLSAAAAAAARTKYLVRDTAEQFNSIYAQMMEEPKRSTNCEEVFGKTPSAWFSSCLGRYSHLFHNDMELHGREQRLQLPFLYEKTKSSAFHFASYFSMDSRLTNWTAMLEADLASQQSVFSPRTDFKLVNSCLSKRISEQMGINGGVK